jgi:large subunit ribosomal protein L35
MKTSRLAYKKFRITGSGRVKSARANTSHNTGKKSAKRMRQLRGTQLVDATKQDMILRMLPNGRR